MGMVPMGMALVLLTEMRERRNRSNVERAMIHYHGTPMGGPRQDVARFMIGRHALVSHLRREDMPIVAEACQSFVVDSGAFTLWKTGGALDVDAYTRWCEEWHRHPGYDWALIPDVIDGDESANDVMTADWPREIRGVPVWHLHESIERLQRLASGWTTVALGSSGQWPTPGKENWWRRMNEAMVAVSDDQGRPVCRLHGLRMLNPAVFTRLPLASADSTNAARNSATTGRFGQYAPPTNWQRAAVIAERVEAHNSAPKWLPSEEQQFAFM
jgi:hypothetical protein